MFCVYVASLTRVSRHRPCRIRYARAPEHVRARCCTRTRGTLPHKLHVVTRTSPHVTVPHRNWTASSPAWCTPGVFRDPAGFLRRSAGRRSSGPKPPFFFLLQSSVWSMIAVCCCTACVCPGLAFLAAGAAPWRIEAEPRSRPDSARRARKFASVTSQAYSFPIDRLQLHTPLQLCMRMHRISGTGDRSPAPCRTTATRARDVPASLFRLGPGSTPPVAPPAE